ncbi:hypothetical protein [Enterobacter mori]|uniref:Adhesin n=1 Tax=Enterobacter mori TaxID=539813 RepID=A0A9Q7NTY7_9ENTR|nr:hypothetical protein [Enterobacter mori]MCC8230620.1 hypothetical protein [Enterobacter mori]MCC8240040.1 hypothetical protein [Enterobacter mori]RTQ25572.1 hypothetical protein EKN29_05865 [Enterobacter mori]
MKTTVKFLASAVALCIVPAASAITLEQAEANLKMASVASRFAEKTYRSALSNEHTTDVAMNNAMDTYGVLSKEAAAAATAHSDAIDQIQKARQAAKDSRATLAAARLAFKNLTPTPVPASQMVPQKISPPMKTPVAIPQATPQKLVSTAIPQPMKVPVAIPQATPQKLVSTAIPQPMKAPVAIPQATPQKLASTAIPQPVKAPIAVPQATPQKLVSTAIPQPVKAPVAIPQATPQKLVSTAIPQPVKAPVAIPQATPQKLVSTAIPQPMKTPVAIPQATPQKLIPTAIPQPMKTPVAIPQATPQKLASTAIPQPMNTPGPISQNVPNKKNVLTAAPTNMTTQIVVTKTQPTTLSPGLPKNAVINPQTPYKSSVTIIDPTTQPTSGIVMISKADNTAKQTATAVAPKSTTTSQTAGSTYNVVAINQVNSYYVSQANNRQVADNSQRIDNNSQRIQSNSQRIDGNSKAIDRNAKEIDDTRDELKRGLNNAAAMSSLHYHSDNSWALSTGTANGDGAALAGGLQKGLTSHVAVNMQASTSFDSGWMAGAGISGDF